MTKVTLARVRKLALTLPEAHEVAAWGEPTFRVRNKMFAMYASSGNHHGAGRSALWCKATLTNQQLRIASDAERFFKPPYVGPSGWVGVRLDSGIGAEDVAGILKDAYRLIAPKKLLAQLDD